MNQKEFIIRPCLDVVMHGISKHHPIEPRIGQEFTIEGTTYACKKAEEPGDISSCPCDCDMPQNLCVYMNCCFYSRTDHNNVTFIQLS